MNVRVIVTASAKRDDLEEIGENVLRISVRAPAADNAANHRVRELVAAWAGVAPAAVRIESGHHRPSKRLHIIE